MFFYIIIIFFFMISLLMIFLAIANTRFQKDLEDSEQEQFLSDYLLSHQK